MAIGTRNRKSFGCFRNTLYALSLMIIIIIDCGAKKKRNLPTIRAIEKYLKNFLQILGNLAEWGEDTQTIDLH